ncbi:AI-2E family transporter [Candidatus Solincola tengchongensis]|uniref:AI-2E family transporter n=1 Tax=Candidatus Solincola tengchongensis TaxID=2900693 RepID=UPI00257AE7C4
MKRETGEMMLNEAYSSIRGYFKGTTIIAAFDTALMVAAALILRLPLVGPICPVSFATCYIPSFGGYLGGAFTVIIALAAKGLTAGLVMLGLAILIHTVLQNPVQAVAYGKTLNLHPLSRPPGCRLRRHIRGHHRRAADGRLHQGGRRTQANASGGGLLGR